MKHRKPMALTALLAAAMLAGCSEKDHSSTVSDSASSQSQSSAQNSEAASAADSSKCGVLQKTSQQDKFEIKGLIITSDSGFHEYPSIKELISKGYQTSGLYSDFYLSERVKIYADCNGTTDFYVIPNQPDTDYTEMPEARLMQLCDACGYPFAVTGRTPDAENYGFLGDFYITRDYPAGLYDICFVSRGKVCYVVQINLMPMPE